MRRAMAGSLGEDQQAQQDDEETALLEVKSPSAALASQHQHSLPGPVRDAIMAVFQVLAMLFMATTTPQHSSAIAVPFANVAMPSLSYGGALHPALHTVRALGAALCIPGFASLAGCEDAAKIPRMREVNERVVAYLVVWVLCARHWRLLGGEPHVSGAPAKALLSLTAIRSLLQVPQLRCLGPGTCTTGGGGGGGASRPLLKAVVIAALALSVGATARGLSLMCPPSAPLQATPLREWAHASTPLAQAHPHASIMAFYLVLPALALPARSRRSGGACGSRTKLVTVVGAAVLAGLSGLLLLGEAQGQWLDRLGTEFGVRLGTRLSYDGSLETQSDGTSAPPLSGQDALCVARGHAPFLTALVSRVALEFVFACACLTTLLVGLPPTASVVSDFGRHGELAYVLHAACWPLYQPLFWLGDAAGALAGMMLVGGGDDLDAALDELGTEYTRLAYFGVVACFAAALTLLAASQVAQGGRLAVRAAASASARATDLVAASPLLRLPPPREVGDGQSAGLRSWQPPASAPSRLASARAAVRVLAPLIAWTVAVNLAIRKLVLPGIAEPAVMPSQRQRDFFCTVTRLEQCGLFSPAR